MVGGSPTSANSRLSLVMFLTTVDLHLAKIKLSDATGWASMEDVRNIGRNRIPCERGHSGRRCHLFRRGHHWIWKGRHFGQGRQLLKLRPIKRAPNCIVGGGGNACILGEKRPQRSWEANPPGAPYRTLTPLEHPPRWGEVPVILQGSQGAVWGRQWGQTGKIPAPCHLDPFTHCLRLWLEKKYFMVETRRHAPCRFRAGGT